LESEAIRYAMKQFDFAKSGYRSSFENFFDLLYCPHQGFLFP
jgi:hypothetical protein